MKIDKELLWIGSYLDTLQPDLDLTLLNEIKILPAPEKTRQTIVGLFTRTKTGDMIISISILAQAFKKNTLKIDGLVPYSRIDVLSHLAHELAHFILVVKNNEWEHTPEHKAIESMIMVNFMEQLSKEGFISEEDELKKHRKRRK